jgi:4-hydroxy-tetrahydrodipicolinate synthase
MFASPIDVPTIQRLAELPRIIGIKDSSGDIAFMLRMMAAVQPIRPDFVFLTGWEAALMPMLTIGCHGGTHATSGVVPEVTKKLYDLTRAGRLDEARSLQLKLIELFDALLYSTDFPEGVRLAVELRGFKMGPSRQPATQLQQNEHAAIAFQIEQLLHGFEEVALPAPE